MRMWRKRNPIFPTFFSGNVNWCNHCGRVWRFLKKTLKIESSYDPAIPQIPLLGICPKKMKTLIQTDNTLMLTEALFIYNSQDTEIAKCSLTVKWIKKMWYIHTMGYCSVIKKKKILSFITIWKDLNGLMFNEIRQKRQILHDIIFMRNFLKSWTQNKLVAARGCGGCK